MANACALWTELNPAGGLSRQDSHVYLQFRESNLLVRLAGPSSREDADLDEVVLRQTDALGLGLEAADFARGVAICRDDSPEGLLGWRCRSVRVMGLDDDGEATELRGPAVAAEWLARS